MRWEDLKVYRPLPKEALKDAFKDFTKIIAAGLQAFGFALHGQKLIAHSDDLLQVIHIDTRGSWKGVSEYFKIEISLIAVSDKSAFTRGFELTGIKRIENIAAGIRDNYRISQEYPLLADFLIRKIIETVLPYFNKYNNSQKVLHDREYFELKHAGERNDNLILFCQLQNGIDIDASKIVDKTLSFYLSLYPDKPQLAEYFQELELYQQALLANNWRAVEQKLEANKIEVFKRLKIKPGNKSL